MRLTEYNYNREYYEIPVTESNVMWRTDCRKGINYFVFGEIIDRLAEYENTELTPQEIENMKQTNKKQSESNRIQKENLDEYFIEYQKLLDENYHLKELLKNYLEQEN